MLYLPELTGPTLGKSVDDQKDVLDYESPQRRTPQWPMLLFWLVPLLTGTGAGYLLSSSGYGWFGAAIMVGFLVAAFSAASTPDHPLAFGLVGNGVTVGVCVLCITLRDRWAGSPTRDVALMVLALTAVVVISGLFGIGLVSAIRWWRDD
jgi:hypothetical protein